MIGHIKLTSRGDNICDYINEDLIPVIVSLIDEVGILKSKMDKVLDENDSEDSALIRTMLEDRVEELENSLLQLEKVNSENLRHIATLQEENARLRQANPISYHINSPDGDL